MEESKIKKISAVFSVSQNPSNEKTDFKIKQLEVETKKLLDKFSHALEGIKTEEECNVIRDKDRRKESSEGGKVCDEGFREIMFENAPQKDKDFIFAEKKTW